MPTNSQAPKTFWFYRIIGIGAIVGSVMLGRRGMGTSTIHFIVRT